MQGSMGRLTNRDPDETRRIPSVRRGAIALATVAVLAAGGSTPPPATGPGARVTALSGGRALPSPQAAAIPAGVGLLPGGTTTAVGPRGTSRAAPDARVHDCS